MTCRQHYLRDLLRGREPFGRGENRERSVLLVPELRKRRGLRNDKRLRHQMHEAARRMATGEV